MLPSVLYIQRVWQGSRDALKNDWREAACDQLNSQLSIARCNVGMMISHFHL
jgi:hypothetical protein